MRACGACMYCPKHTQDREADTGECWNRPPMIIPIPQPVDAEGRIQVELLSLRPTVSLSQYCAFFVHFRPKPDAKPDDKAGLKPLDYTAAGMFAAINGR